MRLLSRYFETFTATLEDSDECERECVINEKLFYKKAQQHEKRKRERGKVFLHFISLPRTRVAEMVMEK